MVTSSLNVISASEVRGMELNNMSNAMSSASHFSTILLIG